MPTWPPVSSETASNHNHSISCKGWLNNLKLGKIVQVPNQMAAEVEEEFCRNGKKFPNYCKEKDISATTLVAPRYKYHQPSVNSLQYEAEVPGANEHCHQDGDDALQDDRHGVVLLHCRLMEGPRC